MLSMWIRTEPGPHVPFGCSLYLTLSQLMHCLVARWLPVKNVMTLSTQDGYKDIESRYELLESHVRGNLHAWFGGGRWKRLGNLRPRQRPTRLREGKVPKDTYLSRQLTIASVQ